MGVQYKKKYILPRLAFLFLFMPIGIFAQQVQTTSPRSNEVTLSLHQADIQDLVRWASAFTKRTIIIHPAVSGRVTVVAGEPLSTEEAYQVFTSVLQVHGFLVVDTGTALKVIPENLGQKSDLPITNLAHDQPEDMVVRIFKIANISAADVISIVRPMLSAEAYIAAFPETNTLIVASRAAKLEQVAQIINRLDKVGKIDVEILPVRFAVAEDVSQLLTRFLPESTRAGQKNGLKIAVDKRSNSILISGDSADKRQIRALVERLDQPLPGDGNTQVIFLQYARAEKLVPILESVSGSVARGEKDQQLSSAEINIRADESVNSLIISAPPTVMSTINGVIAKLDVRRAQVLVEALIVEVNEDFSRDLGVEWRTDLGGGKEQVFAGASTFPNAVGPFSVGADGGVTLGRGLSLGYFRGTDLRAIIRALEGVSDANVLSTPTILAMDNEEATILVGSNVPFVTGSQSREGNRDPFQTIQRQDIGVSLAIRPHVNNSDSVTLEIEQTVESIAQTDAATADIVTNKREIATRALIDNDQILVLGGLIRDEVVESESKVPLLGSLPLLGRAFKSTSSKVVKQNLMVFIHPVILRDSDASYRVTRDRYNYMQESQVQFRDRIDNFFTPGEVPQLPALKPLKPATDSGTE